ncbi:MAG: HlyD family secretion protein [Hyphomicrobiaceae bacterium]
MAERSRILSYGLPLAALLAGGYAITSIVRSQPPRQTVEPAIQPPVQPSSRAAVNGAGFIGSAGLVEPQGQEVWIGTPLSGIVASVAVVPGQQIRAGDKLFELDQRTAAAQLALRKAELAVAESRLVQTEARIPALRAALDAARAGAAAAAAELEESRDQRLSSEELKQRDSVALSIRELTKRRNAERAAAARVGEAQARVAQAEAELALIAGTTAHATLDVERASVEQARSAVQRAEADLSLLTVRSPIDATVLQVNLRAGELAQAGAVTSPLIVIGALDPLHVRVDIDEADIGRFSPAGKVYASLRGQAGRRAELVFVRVEPLVVPKRALSGGGTERVDTRVLRVIYALPSGALAAYPGQQVDVFIEVTDTAAAMKLSGAGKPGEGPR